MTRRTVTIRGSCAASITATAVTFDNDARHGGRDGRGGPAVHLRHQQRLRQPWRRRNVARSIMGIGGSCAPSACAETQIRKVNVMLQHPDAEPAVAEHELPVRTLSSRRSACARWRLSIGTVDTSGLRSRSDAMKTSLIEKRIGNCAGDGRHGAGADQRPHGRHVRRAAGQPAVARDRSRPERRVRGRARRAGKAHRRTGGLVHGGLQPQRRAAVDCRQHAAGRSPASPTRRRAAPTAPATRSAFTPDPGPGPNTGNPLAFPSTDITTGPFEGLKGLITPYTLTVTARSDDR